MKNVNFNRIKIFCDTSEEKKIIKFNKKNFIKGFTTNPSLMRQAGVKNYQHFVRKIVLKIKRKPISFEVFSDDLKGMYEQAKKISRWGKNIFVKIPITNSKGKKTLPIIKKLSKEGIKLNITAVFTLKQVQEIKKNIDRKSIIIISIFAGRIADTGIDPEPIIKKSVNLLKGYKNVKILWASTRELINILHAQRCNCQIITVPDKILNNLNKLKKSLVKYSIETVRTFNKDAKLSKFKI